MPDKASAGNSLDIVLKQPEWNYPRHAPPHPFRQAGAYAITVANYKFAPIMASPQRRTEFESLLLRALAEKGLDIFGWVILSNHYHFLIGVQSLDDVSAVLQRLHGSTSHDWSLEDGMTNKRKVWYKFYDRQIRNENHFYSALNYIHYNPVKHNYVTDPFEWTWTSLHAYFRSNKPEWLRQRWHKYPLTDGIAGEFQE